MSKEHKFVPEELFQLESPVLAATREQVESVCALRVCVHCKCVRFEANYETLGQVVYICLYLCGMPESNDLGRGCVVVKKVVCRFQPTNLAELCFLECHACVC